MTTPPSPTPSAGDVTPPAEGPRDGFHAEHIAVSESREGQPWFEWLVAALTLLATLIALAGSARAGVILLVITSWMTATVRLVLRDRSPWKVRSVAFDVTIGFLFGLGLGAVYYSVLLLQ